MVRFSMPILAGAILLGCAGSPAGGQGGGGGPSPSPGATSTPTPPPGGGGGVPGPTASPGPLPASSFGTSALNVQMVVVRDFEFVPSQLTVPVGTTVVWQFQGGQPHTTTSRPGSSVAWDSGLMNAGGVYSVTFDTRGTYAYFCRPHPFMTGTIVVR